MPMKNVSIGLAFCAAAAAITAPAFAGERVRTVRVAVSDEDFASTQSRAELQEDIRRAARKVCFGQDRYVRPSREERACVAKALEGAELSLAEVQTRHQVAFGG